MNTKSKETKEGGDEALVGKEKNYRCHTRHSKGTRRLCCSIQNLEVVQEAQVMEDRDIEVMF